VWLASSLGRLLCMHVLVAALVLSWAFHHA